MALMEPTRDTMVASALRRVATAAVFIPIFVWMVTRGPVWVFSALVSVTAAVALWELYRLFTHAGQPCNGRLGILLGLALVVSFEMAGGNASIVPALPALVLSVAVAIIITAPVVSGGKPATENSSGKLETISSVRSPMEPVAPSTVIRFTGRSPAVRNSRARGR